MKLGHRLRRSQIIVGAAALALIPLTAGSAYAAQSHATSALVPVSQGIGAAALAQATPTSATSSTQPITVSFILKSPNLTALESKVASGWSGAFLSEPQFVAQYGVPRAFTDQLATYLSHFGIRSTKLYSDTLVLSTQGTASEYNSALGVQLKNFIVKESNPNGTGGSHVAEVYGSQSAPMLPANLADNILAVLGLTNYQPFSSSSIPALHQSATGPKSGSLTIPPGERTPADFASSYNLTPLNNAGALGQNNSVGIVTLASLDPGVPYTFWRDILHLSVPYGKIHLINVDGGAGPVSLTLGSDETTLDVEQSGAIAPDSNIYVYQAPNTDYGFVDGFFALASDNVASSFSASWGESETYISTIVNNQTESPGYAAAFDEAFAEAAAQGETGFVSSGDQAAYDAYPDAGTTNLAVDNPGDSPFISAAGGTTLPGVQTYPITNSSGTVTGNDFVNIPSEMTWNWGYLWPMYGALGFTSETQAATALPNALVVGSGGGYSSLFSEPTYQQGVVPSTFDDYQYLTPTNYQFIDGLSLPTTWSANFSPTLSTGANPGGRALPDLSVDADPQTGYAVYDPQFASVFGSSIVMFGGTSFSAPQLNASATVIDSYLGHRVGFWNPLIYPLAASAASPFTPLDSNTIIGANAYSANGTGSIAPGANFVNGNQYYTGTPGAIYNPGSGLGVPNLTKLADELKL